MNYSKQEKKDIRDALNNLIDDINEIWILSEQEEFYTFYQIKSNVWKSDSWQFQIDETGIFIKDYPKTMNPYSLDLKEEDGKSIGEIKMNSGTIRIIVKGNILLSNKPETSKIKVK